VEAVLRKMSGRERGLLYLTVAVVAAALWYSYVLGPVVGRWRSARAEIARKELLHEKAGRIAGRQDAAQQDYQAFVEQLRMKGSDQEEMAALLKEVEGLARGKVRITNVKPHSVKDYEFYKSFNIEIDSEADMESLVKFIYAAEHSTSMLRVERMRIQVKGGDADLLDISLLITKLLVI
jgi:hypothetical protein